MLIAGVDIGNATTEIVIAETSSPGGVGGEPPQPVAWDRRPTRGVKGSPQAAEAAARLLARMERSLGRRCAHVLITPQCPAHTLTVSIDRAGEPTGRLVLLAAGSVTPAGQGYVSGRPVDVEEDPHTFAARFVPSDRPGFDPAVVLVARDPLGFRRTAHRVSSWLTAGVDVVGVLLAGDEARLVAARLPQSPARSVPIVDGVDAEAALACLRVVVEVAPPGGVVATAIDGVRLVRDLQLDEAEHVHAAALARQVRGQGAIAVGVALPSAGAAAAGSELGDDAEPARDALTFVDGTTVAWNGAVAALRGRPVGSLLAVRLPGGEPSPTRDLWVVDPAGEPLGGVLSGMREDAAAAQQVSLSLLSGDEAPRAWPAAFEAPGRRVEVVGSEPAAARAGALTTPGARADALVLDLGGGTIDLVATGASSVTAAGSGELLTTAVARTLGLSSGAAEWVKRGAAVRVESAHVIADEAGGRHFRDRAAAAGTISRLVVAGPAGELPFGGALTPSQWRAIRIALLHAVFGENVRRVVATVGGLGDPSTQDGQPGVLGDRDVVLVGGPAGSDELPAVLATALRGATLGRADVAGRLGHRWAVAYGLLLSS
ncbi:MAG: hypothetical protein JNL54_17435 [Kineosporiaceae bacterium]|nr:hypothetical protein [Kineosporiaceae bacterium]